MTEIWCGPGPHFEGTREEAAKTALPTPRVSVEQSRGGSIDVRTASGDTSRAAWLVPPLWDLENSPGETLLGLPLGVLPSTCCLLSRIEIKRASFITLLHSGSGNVREGRAVPGRARPGGPSWAPRRPNNTARLAYLDR